LAVRAEQARGGTVARRRRLDSVALARDAYLEQRMNKHIGVGAPLEMASLRANFPILATKVYGKPLVYLDNAASAQKPKEVVERMLHATYHEYANVHRGLHYLANAATDAYEAARESVRAFLNAESASEIVFTKSATEAINLVAASFGEAFIKEGDEIVLSIMEHHANIVPWHFLRERKGAVLKWLDIDDEGNFLLDAFERALTAKTKIVALTHLSNVLGTVTPVKEIVRIAHERGIPVLIDGSQGAVHLDVDVVDLDVDFYCLTGHKLYGPTGIGALYGKRVWLEKLPPFLGGGEMIDEVTKDRVTYNEPPHRFEAGTPPIVQAIGLGAAVNYVQRIGRERIHAHELGLSNYAHERLSRINSLRLYGRAKGKGAIVSFNMDGAHAHDVATVLDRCGVAVRAGTHCAQPLLSRFSVTSTCRASFALYNTFEEVDKLAGALIKAEGLFA
jgi:cysteine desulfurase / selenocysteine lyase